jgi:hypothetical protein
MSDPSESVLDVLPVREPEQARESEQSATPHRQRELGHRIFPESKPVEVVACVERPVTGSHRI